MKKRIIALTTASLLAFVLVLGFLAMPAITPDALALPSQLTMPSNLIASASTPQELPQEEIQQLFQSHIGIVAHPATYDGTTHQFTVGGGHPSVIRSIQRHLYNQVQSGNITDGARLIRTFRLWLGDGPLEGESVSFANGISVRLDVPGIVAGGNYAVFVHEHALGNFENASFTAGDGSITISMYYFSQLIMGGLADNGPFITIAEIPDEATEPPTTEPPTTVPPPQPQTPSELTPAQASQAISMAGITVSAVSDEDWNPVDVEIDIAPTNVTNAQRAQARVHELANAGTFTPGSIVRHIFQVTADPADTTDVWVTFSIPSDIVGPHLRALHSTDGTTWNSVPITGANGTVAVLFPSFSYVALIGPAPETPNGGDGGGGGATAATTATPLSPQTGQ